MNYTTINKELVDFFRETPIIFTYFDKEQIFDDSFNHQELLKNNVVSDSILDYYYKCNEGLGYGSKRITPYSINIFGAYHRKCDFLAKLKDVLFLNIGVSLNDKKPYSIDDLKPYFLDYKRGFKYGFKNFEKDKVEKFMFSLADKEDFANKVYEFIINRPKTSSGFFVAQNWLSANTFSYTMGKSLNIIKGYDDGVRNGYFYKAWSIVFSHNNLFKPFFDSIEQPQKTEADKPDEVKKDLYNYIFKGNAFEVFEKYHTSQNLTEQSKTDLNLLFQLFTDDNLFLETIELKHYIKWLNKTYKYDLIELKKINKNSRPNIQRTNVYKEFKNTTLKKP